MTPAQTTNVTTISAATQVQSREYYFGVWYPWGPVGTMTATSNVDVKLRPQSINNPVRVDGTRAVSGWNHRWAFYDGRPRRTQYINSINSNFKLETKLYGPLLDAGGNSNWRDVIGGCGGTFTAFGSDFPYGIESRARTQFLSALANGKADLGVALGEIRQTGQLVASAAGGALKAIDRAVKAGRDLPKNVVREILNFGRIPPRRRGEPASGYNRRVQRERAVLQRWLEYQFGVKPLIQDIQDAGQALSDKLFVDEVPQLIHIKKGAGETSTGSHTNWSCYGTSYLLQEARADVESACHFAATYFVPLGTGRTFNELGMLNPASLAWELTLYSWLVDYLTTTGEWLESLTARTGTVFREGTMTQIQRVTNVQTRVRQNPFYPQISVSEGTEWEECGFVGGNMVRTVLSDVLPAYRPAVHERLNLTKMANVLSVLALRARLT